MTTKYTKKINHDILEACVGLVDYLSVELLYIYSVLDSDLGLDIGQIRD